LRSVLYSTLMSDTLAAPQAAQIPDWLPHRSGAESARQACLPGVQHRQGAAGAAAAAGYFSGIEGSKEVVGVAVSAVIEFCPRWIDRAISEMGRILAPVLQQSQGS